MVVPEKRDAELLCAGGLQHGWVLTAWETVGAQSHWASELLCPTCGSSITREVETGDWTWNAPED